MASGPRTAVLASLDEVELQVERLVEGGYGFARHLGVPILVPRAAPGDRLRVVIVERHPDYGVAEIVEILKAGPERCEPLCPHYGECGGCDLQHVSPSAQSSLKSAAARETLRRLGGIEIGADVPCHAAEPWGYRSRASFQVRGRGEDIEIGFHRRGSHDLVAVRTCPVLHPILADALPEIDAALRRSEHSPRRLDVAADGQRWSASPLVPGLPGGKLQVEVGAHRLDYDPRCFSQAHHGLLAALQKCAVGTASGDLAVDLYAGVGLFTVALSDHYRRVIAVEGDGTAARYLRKNARRAARERVEVHHLQVETWLSRTSGPCDRILVDPPRGGLSVPVRRWLREAGGDRLTYVSCQAPTLARDLAALSSSYRIESVEFFDLFPQTAHLEAVVQLQRIPGTRKAVAPPASRRSNAKSREGRRPGRPGRPSRPSRPSGPGRPSGRPSRRPS